MTHFTEIVTLLWSSRTKPTISPRYACRIENNLEKWKKKELVFQKDQQNWPRLTKRREGSKLLKLGMKEETLLLILYKEKDYKEIL